MKLEKIRQICYNYKTINYEYKNTTYETGAVAPVHIFDSFLVYLESEDLF